MKFGLEIQIIENIISVLEQHPKVDKAFVFGSRAKGNYRPDSDIDIAIKGNGITTDDIIAISVAIETKGITHKFDLIDYDSIKEPALKEHIDIVGIEFYRKWKEYRFSELLIDESISYGIVQPGTHTEIDSVPIIRVNNIKNGKIITDEIMKVSSSIEEKYLRTRLVGGELLITVVGSVGECAIVPENLKGWNVARAVSVARIKKDYNVNYIKYAFKTDDLIFQMYGNTNDTVQPTLNLSLLKELKFTLPSLSEQSAIASILSSLDDKIDLLHRQNKTLEQLAETLFRQWFVEEAEESWETKTISEIIEVRDGTHDSPKQAETGRYLITSKHLKSTGIDFSTAYKISESDFANVNKRSKVDKDDILFSMIGTLGLIHYVDKEPDFAIKNMGLFKSSQKPSFARFLYLLLISPEGKRFVYENADGSTQEYITLSSLRNFEFKYPGDIRIEEFDIEIKPIFQKIESNQTQIRTLTQTRDTLLPKLMSGEVRVYEQ